MTTIVTESYLFISVRSLAHRVNRHLGVLFGCFLCFGTWVGLGLGLIVVGGWHGILAGLAYHGLAYLMHLLATVLGDLRVWLQR